MLGSPPTAKRFKLLAGCLRSLKRSRSHSVACGSVSFFFWWGRDDAPVGSTCPHSEVTRAATVHYCWLVCNASTRAAGLWCLAQPFAERTHSCDLLMVNLPACFFIMAVNQYIACHMAINPGNALLYRLYWGYISHKNPCCQAWSNAFVRGKRGHGQVSVLQLRDQPCECIMTSVTSWVERVSSLKEEQRTAPMSFLNVFTLLLTDFGKTSDWLMVYPITCKGKGIHT